MAHQIHTHAFGRDFEFEYASSLVGYWTVFLRIVVGYWFLMAGLTKYAWFPGGEAFSAAGWMTGATQGTLVHGFLSWVAGVPVLLTFTNVMIPLGETLIGLGVLLGAFVRLASIFGAFLMAFFYLGNANFAHGYVNSEFMGLVLFLTLIVWGAGRIYGVDGFLEATATVRRHPWLRYLLG